MTAIKSKLRDLLLAPEGKVGRAVTLAMLCLSSLSFIYQFWLLEFFVCGQRDCSLLSITDIWVKFSYMFLVAGLSNLGAAIFIFRNGSLAKIYAICISFGFLTTSVLTGFIPFAVAHELSAFQ